MVQEQDIRLPLIRPPPTFASIVPIIRSAKSGLRPWSILVG